MDELYFLFYKQKTAYEMRISDWSSDVCSSDLLVQALHKEAAKRNATKRRNPSCGPENQRETRASPGKPRFAATRMDRAQKTALQTVFPGHRRTPLGDRKRVVEGQRVSVRVDLGGRRTI